ncbi:hypothetical protein O9993_10920 [Vibrio lentus]|nr:hypothetical protein [Vibrio lentus]
MFDVIIKGELKDPILMASALTALKIKGETPDDCWRGESTASPRKTRSHALITISQTS